MQGCPDRFPGSSVIRFSSIPGLFLNHTSLSIAHRRDAYSRPECHLPQYVEGCCSPRPAGTRSSAKNAITANRILTSAFAKISGLIVQASTGDKSSVPLLDTPRTSLGHPVSTPATQRINLPYRPYLWGNTPHICRCLPPHVSSRVGDGRHRWHSSEGLR